MLTVLFLILIACPAIFCVLDKDIVEYFDAKFARSEQVFNSTMDNKIDAMFERITRRHHDYVAELAAVLELTSTQITCIRNGKTLFATEHSVFYDGYVFTVGVKHCDCYSDVDTFKLRKSDVLFRLGCPTTSVVLDVTTYAPLRTGDEASTLGYVDTGVSRFWNGRLSGKLGKLLIVDNITFEATEYLFEGVSQISGMSGGAGLNGWGYTGMVHGTHSYPDTVKVAVVIPAQTIFDGFNGMTTVDKAAHMKKLGDCPGVTVRSIPRY